jgi:hypothetical protein
MSLIYSYEGLLVTETENLVLCPFWKESRSRYMKVVKHCDNLVGNVPFCIANKYFDNSDTFDPPVLACEHFVITDYYDFTSRKRPNECYFGGKKSDCLNSKNYCSWSSCPKWSTPSKR